MLKAGETRLELVRSLASFLRNIAEQSRGSAAAKSVFYKPSLIESLRLEPYFLATAERHPDLSGNCPAW
ncbi:MAG: hypothetical protein R3C04_08955 [Hyphomonas sp.]